MPRYEITGPDGERFEISAPEGASQEQVLAHARSHNGGVEIAVGGGEPPKDNQSLGFNQGMAETVGHMSENLPQPPWMRPITDFAQAKTQELIQHQQQQATARGEVAGRFGHDAGEIVGSAPTWAFGGPMASGALEGFATSGADDMQGKLLDAAKGAAGGKLGSVAMKGLGAAVRGVTDPAVHFLAERGVQLSPGQVFGGAPKWLEDRLTSYPFIGPEIDKVRGVAMDGFNRGAVDQALSHVGERVPAGVRTGHDAISWADDLLGQSYDAITPGLGVHVDPRMGVGARKIADEMATMTDNGVSQVNKTIAHLLKSKDFSLTGTAVRRADGELGAKARANSRSPLASEQEVGHALRTTQGVLRDAMERQNPEAAAKLKALNQAFRELLPIENAAAGTGAREGVFTPAQLKSGARAMDPSIRKKASARGEAPMQAYAEAGQAKLNTVADSGTAGRISALSPYHAVAGILARIAYEGEKAGAKAATMPRGDKAKALAEAIRRRHLLGARAGATAATQGKD